MSYYQHHVFFCTNERDDGRPSCGERCAGDLRDYAKKKVKGLGSHAALASTAARCATASATKPHSGAQAKHPACSRPCSKGMRDWRREKRVNLVVVSANTGRPEADS